MTPRAQERSAFCTRRGLYHFKRMPFGLSNAPAIFCRLMHRVLRDHLWRICLCYLDDVIVYATSRQKLLERLHTILSCLHNVELKVKPSKCSLFKERISFLGHMVSADGIDPQEEKIKSIQEWPVPKCVRDVPAFFDIASYYRKFVQNFASIAEPLSALTKKGVRFSWSHEAQQAFERLRRALAETVTARPNFHFRHRCVGCRGGRYTLHRGGRSRASHRLFLPGNECCSTKLLSDSAGAPCGDRRPPALPSLP